MRLFRILPKGKVNDRWKNVGCHAKGNGNFATKAISTENVEKKDVVEVRRKNETCFFSKLLSD